MDGIENLVGEVTSINTLFDNMYNVQFPGRRGSYWCPPESLRLAEEEVKFYCKEVVRVSKFEDGWIPIMDGIENQEGVVDHIIHRSRSTFYAVKFPSGLTFECPASSLRKADDRRIKPDMKVRLLPPQTALQRAKAYGGSDDEEFYNKTGQTHRRDDNDDTWLVDIGSHVIWWREEQLEEVRESSESHVSDSESSSNEDNKGEEAETKVDMQITVGTKVVLLPPPPDKTIGCGTCDNWFNRLGIVREIDRKDDTCYISIDSGKLRWWPTDQLKIIEYKFKKGDRVRVEKFSDDWSHLMDGIEDRVGVYMEDHMDGTKGSVDFGGEFHWWCPFDKLRPATKQEIEEYENSIDEEDEDNDDDSDEDEDNDEEETDSDEDEEEHTPTFKNGDRVRISRFTRGWLPLIEKALDKVGVIIHYDLHASRVKFGEHNWWCPNESIRHATIADMNGIVEGARVKLLPPPISKEGGDQVLGTWVSVYNKVGKVIDVDNSDNTCKVDLAHSEYTWWPTDQLMLVDSSEVTKEASDCVSETTDKKSEKENTMAKKIIETAKKTVSEMGEAGLEGLKISSAHTASKTIIKVTREMLGEHYPKFMDTTIASKAEPIVLAGVLHFAAGMLSEQLPKADVIQRNCLRVITAESKDNSDVILTKLLPLLKELGNVLPNIPEDND